MDPTIGYHGFHFLGTLLVLFLGILIGKGIARRRFRRYLAASGQGGAGQVGCRHHDVAMHRMRCGGAGSAKHTPPGSDAAAADVPPPQG